MPNHKNAELPEAMEGSDEPKVQIALVDLKQCVNDYIKENCDENGNQEDNLKKAARGRV